MTETIEISEPMAEYIGIILQAGMHGATRREVCQRLLEEAVERRVGGSNAAGVLLSAAVKRRVTGE